MGGCATKPKADTTNPPAPAPVPEKEDSAAAPDVKEAVVPPDDANKRQSLSNLLKVEEEKGTTEVAETPSETKTLDEITVSEKATDVSGEEAHELAKIDTPAEQTSRDVTNVDAKIETQVSEENKTELPEEKKEVITEISNVSLSMEEEKGTTEVVETPTKTKTLDEITASEKATDVSEEEAHELAKIDTPAEQTSEVDTKIETQVSKETNAEIPEEKKEVAEETPVPVETKVEKAITVDANTETEKPEESKTEVDEKRIEETPVADAEKPKTKATPETSEEKKAITLEDVKMATEEIPVEEIKSPELSVEKKTEEAK